MARTPAWFLLGLIFWIESLTPDGVNAPPFCTSAPILLFLPFTSAFHGCVTAPKTISWPGESSLHSMEPGYVKIIWMLR